MAAGCSKDDIVAGLNNFGLRHAQRQRLSQAQLQEQFFIMADEYLTSAAQLPTALQHSTAYLQRLLALQMYLWTHPEMEIARTTLPGLYCRALERLQQNNLVRAWTSTHPQWHSRCNSLSASNVLKESFTPAESVSSKQKLCHGQRLLFAFQDQYMN